MAGIGGTRMWYKTCKTEEEAKQYCDKENKPGTRSYYMRKQHPACYYEMHSEDGSEVYWMAWTTR